MDPAVESEVPGKGRARRVEAGLFVVLWSLQAALLLGAFRPEHDWGDDFAGYILQARAWVEGRPMAETGYLFSRLSPEIGPSAYPPGLPLLLAPIYARHGADIGWMKLEMLAIHLVGLGLLALFFRRLLPPGFALAAWAAFAWSPAALAGATRVLSEGPFLAICAGLWLLAERAGRREPARAREVLLLTLWTAVATSLRAIGILLPVAMASADLAARRTISRRTVGMAAGAAVALLVGQLPAFRGQQDYLVHLSNLYGGAVWRNAAHYLTEGMVEAWPGPTFEVGAGRTSWLWALAAAFVAWGFWRRLRQGPGLTEAMFVLVGIVLLVAPFRSGARYLLPILPLFCLYGGVGAGAAVTALRRRFGPRPARALALAAVAALGGLLVGSARAIPDPWPGDYHPDGATATELFDFIRRRTPRDATLVVFKPRAFVLFTERRAAAFPHGHPAPVARAFLAETAADYLIAARFDPRPDDQALAAAFPAVFERVFENADYRVFRISGRIAGRISGEVAE